eukprot:Awhi_evm1s13731
MVEDSSRSGSVNIDMNAMLELLLGPQSDNFNKTCLTRRKSGEMDLPILSVIVSRPSSPK